ncbi:MAG: hypothetical protein IPM08_00135 [Actinomycetales bacterium]|nr:hypothetical protein [Actinomycetales bacterium]
MCLAAAFTAVSASCVTGLLASSTPRPIGRPSGRSAPRCSCQVGGFGIMTMATRLAILFGGSAPGTRLVAQSESHAPSMGNVKAILRTIGTTVVITEVFLWDWCSRRASTSATGVHSDRHSGRGCSTRSRPSTTQASRSTRTTWAGFNQDIWIIGLISAAIVAGGLGFPVFYEALPPLAGAGKVDRPRQGDDPRLLRCCSSGAWASRCSNGTTTAPSARCRCGASSSTASSAGSPHGPQVSTRSTTARRRTRPGRSTTRSCSSVVARPAPRAASRSAPLSCSLSSSGTRSAARLTSSSATAPSRASCCARRSPSSCWPSGSWPSAR